ncbi:MAG: DUF748 domain-containing protein [Bacteroidales bacterium]|nr:DUF748 domain-containing protein [Bacteroidales bacterium]
MAGFFRKLRKGLLWALAIVFALIVLILSFSGTIARHYIQKNGNSLIGRDVTIGSLSINPLTAGMRVKDLHILEKDGKEDFLSLSSLEGNIRLRPVTRRIINIKGISIDSLYINIVQDGDRFNFDDLKDKLYAYLEEDTEDSGWTMDIRNIALTGGRIRYRDMVLGSKFALNKISLEIPKINLSGKNTDVGTVLSFEEGGQMDCRISYNPDRSRFTVNVSLKDFGTDGLTPYLQQFLNVKRCKGSVSGHLEVHGKTQHIADADIKGSLIAEDLKVIDEKRKPVFSAESLKATISNFSLGKGIAHLKELEITGPKTYYEILKDSTDNFTHLIKDEEQQREEESPQVKLLIDSLCLRDGKVDFKDNTLKESFSYKLSEISLACSDFRLDKMNILTGSAVAGKAGKVEFEWTTDFVRMKNVYLDIIATNINVKDFTPYSKYYVGNNIEGGTMRWESHNTIIGGHLEGSNQIEIYKPKVSRRSKWTEPVYEAPVRLGVYALTNKKGLMNISLPVKGNLDNPDFSYRKTVLKALLNVFTKVSAAPLRAVGKMLTKGEDLDHIEIDLEEGDFSTREYGKLEQIVETMKEKDEFHYTFRQRFNLGKALRKEEKEKVLSLAQSRNENLSNYLKRMGIPSRNYTVEPVQVDSLSAYKGKNCFFVDAIWEEDQ